MSTNSGEPGATSIVGGVAFNTSDVGFAQNMIPHHSQAVEMADVALGASAGAGEKVLSLATRIKGAQDPEIKLMTSWLTTWGQPIMAGMGPGETMAPGQTMPGMAGMEGMMSAAEMTSLSAASGPAFDKQWLTLMIKHHEGAIVMAEAVKESGVNPDAAKLASAIISAQQTEIAEMKAVLAA
jgi:uncharacterized protein (DUF305 family)